VPLLEPELAPYEPLQKTFQILYSFQTYRSFDQSIEHTTILVNNPYLLEPSDRMII